MGEAKPPKKMTAALRSPWRVRKAWDEDGWEIYPDYKTKLGDPCEVARTTDAHKAPRWVAELIADAGNTYNTTGLTPSQLVERVKELEELLNGVLMMGRGTSGRIIVEGWQEEVLRAALSKARPNTAEGEAHADSVREDAALLSLLEELSDHDSYDTEYDGRMISLCPECGSQDGEHSKNCAFRRAKEYLAARKQAAAKEPSP